MKPNSTSTVADKVAALMPRQGRYGSCFALASLTLVLPSEPRDNLKIALSDKLCANTAEISALFGVSPQNTPRIPPEYPTVKNRKGAAICKKIGSPAYDTWIEALVKLNDTYIGSKPYNAVDLIDKAYSRTLEDLCCWIFAFFLTLVIIVYNWK